LEVELNIFELKLELKEFDLITLIGN